MTAPAETAATLARVFALSRVSLPAWMARVVNVVRAIGPYAAIEILLPGGTLMALALWLYRRHRKQKRESLSFAGESLPPAVAQLTVGAAV